MCVSIRHTICETLVKTYTTKHKTNFSYLIFRHRAVLPVCKKYKNMDKNTQANNKQIFGLGAKLKSNKYKQK